MALKTENFALAALADNGEASGPPLQYVDVAVRFLAFVAVTVAAAFAAWLVLPVAHNIPTIAILLVLLANVFIGFKASRQMSSGSVIGGLGLGAIYCGIQGVFVGWISHQFAFALGSAVILQVLTATSLTFLAVIAYSVTDYGKKSGRALHIFVPAMLGYLGFSVVNFIMALAGFGDGWGFTGPGLLGTLLCAVGVLFAAWSTNVDVVAVIDKVGEPTHKGTAWLLGFALAVDLTWMYFEFLRLFGRR